MKTQKKLRISTIIIIVLLVFLIISTARAVKELVTYNQRFYDTAQLNYMIRESDYAGMTYDYYNERADLYAGRMKEDKASMGQFETEAEVINKILQIGQ